MSRVGGGEEPPHSPGGGSRPLPSFPTPMIHRPIYIHQYVNTLLSISVILVHFPRTSEPANTHAYFLCVHSHPSQCPQPNAPTHTGPPSRASPSGFPLGGFRSPSSASREPDVIMTPVSYFWSPQVFPERSMNTRYWVTICRNNVTPLFAYAAT